MNWDTLASIIAALISALLWLAAWNEICVEIRTRGTDCALPCEALRAWYTKRQFGKQRGVRSTPKGWGGGA